MLAELITSDESPSQVAIRDESPNSFEELLRYIYGCELPDFAGDVVHTKELIEIANKYGVTNLKLQAEAYYASSICMPPQ